MSNRPWWWWINPWLYIARRDQAYEVALDELQEQAWEINRLRVKLKEGGAS